EALRSRAATWKPSLRSRCAMASPMPEAPPVTTAVFTLASPLSRPPAQEHAFRIREPYSRKDRLRKIRAIRAIRLWVRRGLDSSSSSNRPHGSAPKCTILLKRECYFHNLRGGGMSTQEEAVTATQRLLIDGQLIETGRTLASLNPANGEVVGHAPEAGVAEVDAAVAAARRAFDTTDWSTNHEFRAHCLEQLYQALQDNVEELRALMIAEVGASYILTKGNQLETPFEIVKYYAGLLKDYTWTEDLGPVEIRGAQHQRWVEKEGAGVVAAIAAYNYPYQLAFAKLAPSLAAGCTVVLKGAPDTPLITLALGELIAQHTDIPAGVVNILTSSEVAVGERMTTHPDVDVVSFTGSTPVGRKIMAAASATLKKVFLELGGKSAAILLDDADYNMGAMFAAFSICSHAGQGCAIT